MSRVLGIRIKLSATVMAWDVISVFGKGKLEIVKNCYIKAGEVQKFS